MSQKGAQNDGVGRPTDPDRDRPGPGLPPGAADRLGEMGHERASTLLRLGLKGPRRGVDDAIERLVAPEGPIWLEESLGALGLPPAGVREHRASLDPAARATDQLVAGRASATALREAKERHKAAMLGGQDRESRVRSILLYYLCIAAALAHHRERITAQATAELSDALLDLAGALPEPWALLAARAAARLDER